MVPIETMEDFLRYKDAPYMWYFIYIIKRMKPLNSREFSVISLSC